MFYQPKTVEEALALKAELGAEGTFLAGGTDLVVLLSRGLLHFQHVIDLSHTAGLAEVSQENGSYRVGGATTHSQLEQLPVAGLAYAASTVGGVQIRNRGTVAGNIVTASPAGDVSVALLGLDAELELTGNKGSRRLPLSEFFLGYKKTALQPDEMIVAVRFPRDARHAFVKFGKREATAISLVCGSAGLLQDGRVCIGLGSVGPFPLRAPKAEAQVQAHGLGTASIAEAARLAAEEAAPMDDHRASADYRRALVEIGVRRMLGKLSKDKENNA